MLQLHFNLSKEQIGRLTYSEVKDRLSMLPYVSPYGTHVGESPPEEYSEEEQKEIAEMTRKKLEELNRK